MTKPQPKPQCGEPVEGTNTEGRTETFFCLKRVGHRGPHSYHASMAEAKPDHPLSAVVLPRPT